jgi:serine protease AprX
MSSASDNADEAGGRERPPSGYELIRPGTVSEALRSPKQREELGMPADDHAPLDVVVELNLLNQGGLEGAMRGFRELFAEVAPERGEPVLVANTYFQCRLSAAELQELVSRDQRSAGQRKEPKDRTVYRVWPDFPVGALIDRSVATVKADAARRSFEASGTDITWAVVDSGIDALHPHFMHFETLAGDVNSLHRDFTQPGEPQLGGALTDAYGHGTHVAGIIAGGLPLDAAPPLVVQHVADERDNPMVEQRTIADASRLAGVAPRCKLVSLKVLNEKGVSRSTDVLRALQYVREQVNGHGKLLRIHGVNLSVGYEFDARWFACGQSPICVEVDRLVQSGVVVVVAAGNTGYGRQDALRRTTNTGLSLTINDPGNAALAITVGATHRDMPHTYGVSYFSSKGPTGDGRLKPDVVAPGERITSCATGGNAALIANRFGPANDRALYIDDSGTSMAAPHVSGAIAAFLSIRREFIGRPDEVKRIFLENATSLGRERYFEGHGMVDLMRAIQAV